MTQCLSLEVGRASRRHPARRRRRRLVLRSARRRRRAKVSAQMFHPGGGARHASLVPLRTRVRQEPDLRRERSGVRTTACSVLRFPTETRRRRPRCARADANPAPRRLGALTTRNPSRPSSQEMCFACFDALLSHLHGDRTHPPAPAYVNHLWCVRALLSLLPARLASRPPAS